MKSLNEDKSISVIANKDRGCLPNLQHALRDLANSLLPESGPSFHRDIDFGDWEALALKHEPYLFGRDPDDQHTNMSWRHEDATSSSACFLQWLWTATESTFLAWPWPMT